MATTPKRKRTQSTGSASKQPRQNTQPASPASISDVEVSLDCACAAIQTRLSGRTLPLPSNAVAGINAAISKLGDITGSAVLKGESNSVLLIGPRNSGKTMAIRSALAQFHNANFITVWLNGLFHTTDQLAVKEIVRQLHMETDVEGARPTTVADCLKFVIETLNSGSKENVPVVFILEEFDLFALHPKQSLLYTLFDIAQTCVNPVLVIGASQRQDCIELLEKRVKSRFSHRILFTRAPNTVEDLMELIRHAVTLSEEDGVVDAGFLATFNSKVKALLKDEFVKEFVKDVINGSADVTDIYKVLTSQLLLLTPDEPYLSVESFKVACSSQLQSPMRDLFNGTSPLEQVLLVAIKQCLYRQINTFNFEIAHEFYKDFIKSNSSKAGSLNFKKDVVFKAFESLQSLEFISLVDSVGNRCPRKHRMFKANISMGDICDLIEQSDEMSEAVKKWQTHGSILSGLRIRCVRYNSVATSNAYASVQRLPIPTLEATCARYLASCAPLLSADELARTTAAVQAFARDGGFGEVLQERLRGLDAKEKNSWLENIWLNKAYLEWREPSLINVNWWCQFADPKTGLQLTSAKDTITDFQINRAAGLISSMLDFKHIIDNRLIPQEFIKDSPLCMNQYNNIFAVTRIPGEKADTISSDYPSKATHIIVQVRNQMYRVDLFSKDGSRVSVEGIAKLLRQAEKDSLSSASQASVGILTAGHRDTNYKGYARLQSISAQNAENLESIRTSLFHVCLDNQGGDKKTAEETHHQIFHNYNGHNRWFDKAIQLIVLPSGRAGVNGEHTPTDAVIPGQLMNFIVKAEPAANPSGAVSADAVAPPKKLNWQVDSEVETLMAEAEKTAGALIADTFSVLLQTDVYGSNYIKDVAKASPDAFVQLALQLAWRRLHNEPTAIYESASIRLFKHGRTETIRSLTTDTWAFASAFDDGSVSMDDKRSLFGKAIKSQSTMARDATFGKGVDRHLLALRTLIQSPEEAKRATLFTDPAYIKSMYFKLSSSNMSPGDAFYGGFGPVVPEGYGVNYAIGKKNLKFSISHKPSCKTTDATKFRETLLRSLVDLQKLFEVEE
ncbi:hypothetical protein CcCBS67573_g06884 [Chytriomyces confervae]|uniref:Origin recognition complex subunit 4 n=1 Tax=Chytriomyces confervae TaxID=246404 RepID=A0A507F172_9FUNG|nr:hypothetical protein CcCBS67573_g06884 [Chytriomyces confervae]